MSMYLKMAESLNGLIAIDCYQILHSHPDVTDMFEVNYRNHFLVNIWTI